MDEDEDDVYRMGLQHLSSSGGQIKRPERGPRTAEWPPVLTNGMLQCRMHAERRRILYGNAGLLLLAHPTRSQSLDVMLRANLQAEAPSAQRPALGPALRPAQTVETLIGQKLQLIGDQFYQEHMMHQRNQRAEQPLWWRVALAFYTLLFRREE